MNVGIIIQARLGSTRLPRKVLLDFYNEKTLIETIIWNLQKVKGVKLIIATSNSLKDDELVNFLIERDIKVYRGSENDVLNRFIEAADNNGIDGIIRICSDNPFLDWRGVYNLTEKAKISKADYIGYRINDVPSIRTHFGFWGEYVTLKALKQVERCTNDLQSHEHVTAFIYSHPELFKCEWIDCPDYLQGRYDIRLTVDNMEDYNNAKQVYSSLYQNNPEFDLEDVVKYIDSNKILQESMKKIISNNIK